MLTVAASYRIDKASLFNVTYLFKETTNFPLKYDKSRLTAPVPWLAKIQKIMQWVKTIGKTIDFKDVDSQMSYSPQRKQQTLQGPPTRYVTNQRLACRLTAGCPLTGKQRRVHSGAFLKTPVRSEHIGWVTAVLFNFSRVSPFFFPNDGTNNQ